MDLYRMAKAKSFRVCLFLAFLFALVQTPLELLLVNLSRFIAPEEAVPFETSVTLSALVRNPFPMLNEMLAMLSACMFFYADMESGYIKNIAGQMPRRGSSILSRYLAAAVHGLVFMLAGLAGNAIGTVFCRKIVFAQDLLQAILVFAVKGLLLQGICAILLLACAGFRNKSLGIVLAVLMGTGLLRLVYAGIETGLFQLLQRDIDLSSYMPDQVLGEASPDLLRAFLVSAVTMAVFLPPAIRVFEKRDIK